MESHGKVSSNRQVSHFAIGLALVVCVIGAMFAAAGSSAETGRVVLGSASFAAPDGEGWGTARPAKIFNGGDPSGLVSHLRWVSWGGKTAIGHGLNAIFKPHGGYYGELAHIELRAQDLGKCSSTGPRAYTQLWFRDPSRPGGPLGPWTLWSEAKTICKI